MEILSILSRYIFFIIFIAIWVAIPVFLYYSYQNKRRREWIESQEYTLIKISVPKEKGIGEGSYTYVLFIQNRDDINKNAPPFGLGERVFSESGITLFKIH